MINQTTLAKYLFKLFASYFLLTSIVIIGLLFLSNAFDVIQKFKSTDISPQIFWQLISLKIPHLYNEISVLIGFLSTILFLRKLITQNELIIITSSGIPIWKIFIIPISATFAFGTIILVLINPLGTYGMKQYKYLESTITNKPQDNFIVLNSGIFFFENYLNSNRVIQAKSIHSAKKELHDVTILVVDNSNQFNKRIDADKAILDHNNFTLINSKIITHDNIEKKEIMNMPTKLSIDNLVQRFIPAEMILIWRLKKTINSFVKSGIATITYQLYYYKQLFKPIIMSAMAFLSCWFISLNIRDNSGTKTLAFSVLLGIIVYFLFEIILRILAFGGVHPIIATLLPVLFIILISNFVILHFQEA
ncbi:MAG: YjgP/YjgQ family permease [Rickettsiaceae bacterium]|nr:YjgP/YjgQ family permease [Rickettsiaceae bacterium]